MKTAGKQEHRVQTMDFKDPFNAGQMVGMLVMLTFIEKHKGIPADMLEKIKQIAATNAQVFLEKPTEDIFLMVDGLVEEIGTQ